MTEWLHADGCRQEFPLAALFIVVDAGIGAVTVYREGSAGLPG